MRGLSKQKYFYYIALILMASTFLPVVFNKLPPIIRSHHLWTSIWGFSILMLAPNLLLSKMMQLVLIYGLLLLIVIKTIWIDIDEWNFKFLINEFYEITIGLSVITYFQQVKDYVSLAKIAKWTIFFLFITGIMTVISSRIDPMYARNIGGVSSVSIENEREAILSFKIFGGGGYSTAAAFMCLFPIMIYYFKNATSSLVSKKVIVIFSIIFILALFGMQIFANILVAIIFSFIAVLKVENYKRAFLIISIFLMGLYLTPKEIFVDKLFSISNYFDSNSDLNYKFRDLALFIESGGDIQDNVSGTGARAERYPMLIETFLKSPLLGCYAFTDNFGNGYKEEGGHLYWMNKLTVTGIFCFLFFLLIPYRFVKSNLKEFTSNYKYYYLLASLSILSYGLMKSLVGRETWYAFFIILPGIYYLPLLKK